MWGVSEFIGRGRVGDLRRRRPRGKLLKLLKLLPSLQLLLLLLRGGMGLG